jgi:hypothetical protein
VTSIFVPDAWLGPAIMVEVLADEITPSPRHTTGMTGDSPGFALRFPLIVSFRTEDKKPEDATSVLEIREMFQQRHRGGKAPLAGERPGFAIDLEQHSAEVFAISK